MTLQAVWIDSETHEGLLYSCGHPYPYRFCKNGEIDVIPTPESRPIGFIEEVPFAHIPLVIEPGERLGLFTDGPIEALWDGVSNAGLEILSNYLKTRPNLPLKEACHDILDGHPQKLSGKPQPDDFTVVLLERSEDA